MQAEKIEIDERFMTLLGEFAIEAGRAIVKIKAEGFEVGLKDDDSPVTRADRSAEDIIIAGLEQHFKSIPVVAEERVADGHVPETDGGMFFLVDALDGTREFVTGRTAYTVNIGLIVNHQPLAGVVFAPEQRRMFTGMPGKATATEFDGTFNATNQATIQCRYMTSHQRIVASRSHTSDETENYIRSHEGSEAISVGSSLKFCLLAEGLADLYPRFGPTMEWDTAAGDAVLRAAGGLTTTVDGLPMVYGKRDRPGIKDFLNPHFIARATNRVGDL